MKMKILVHGVKKKDRNGPYETFTCEKCGCIFQAEDKDFKYKTTDFGSAFNVVKCPECKHTVESEVC